MPAIDRAVEQSLGDFVEFIRRTGWRGRENEAISLYAFGFLLPQCRDDGPLRHPTQIGIEVGAANTPKSKLSQVRKDLVIWREPGCNRWYPQTPRSEPMVIMEWKVRRSGFRSGASNDRDIKWLAKHSARHPKTVGYAVWLDLRGPDVRLLLARFRSGRRKELEL